MDAFGTIITSDREFEDHEFGVQTGETEDLGNSDFDGRVSKTSEQNHNVETRHDDKNDKDRSEAGQSSSSWIGAAVSGWFANDAEETGNGNKEQDQFKGRKLALDLEQLDEEEKPAQLLDWIGDGLTNTFGIGKKDLQPQSDSRLKSKDQKEHNEDPPNEQSSYLLGNGMNNILGDGGGETPPSETKKLSQDEKMQNLMKQQEATSPKIEHFSETISETEKGGDQMDAGWYSSVYNRITNLYGDSAKSETSKDEGKESASDQDMDEHKARISESFLVQSSQNDRNTENREEKQEATGQKQEVASQDQSDETSQLGEGWYGSILNRITEIYGESPNGKDSSDKSEVTENTRGDPETADTLSSRDEKLEHSEHAAENMNSGWYNTVYSRIGNMYRDTSEESHASDVMEAVESQTQSENTKDTSSPSIFSMNGLSSVIDSLRSPSKGAGSDDEKRLSDSVTLEPSLTQSHVHDPGHVTLWSDNDYTEESGLIKTENIDKHQDVDQSPDTSELSMMINRLKSPFKPSDPVDQEESSKEKTPEAGKEGESDNDESVTELSVRSADVISERPSEKEEEEEEEGVLLEVNVAEAQINTVEGKLDCNEQDMSNDGDKISTDISTGLNDRHEYINEFGDQVNSGSALLSTDHNMNKTSELNPDEAENLAVELSWTEAPEHGSDTSERREGEINSHNVNKSISEKNGFTDVPDEEDTHSESETRSESGLHVSEEAQDEAEAVDVLPEAEETDMKVRSFEAGQNVNMASNDEKPSGERENVNITLTEYDVETEGGDIEMEHHGENEGADFTQTESGGENETTNTTQMEFGEEKEGGATQVKSSKGQGDGDGVAQIEPNGENKGKDFTQEVYDEGQNGVNATYESVREREEKATRVKYTEGHDDVDVAQMESGGGNKSGEITQMENAEGAEIEVDGEKESVNIVSVDTGGEKTGDITDVVSDGEKECTSFTQNEFGRETEGVELIFKEQLSLPTADGLINTQSVSESKQDLVLESHDCIESEKCESSAVKQVEITPKDIPDKSPSADGSETQSPCTSHGDQNVHVKENMKDVKRHIAHIEKRVYPNLQDHLHEEDIQALLKFFSGETLSRLDFTIEHFQYHNKKETAELQDFEKTLEHLLKSQESQELEPSLQNIQSFLVMLRKMFIPVKADGNVDKSTGTNDKYTSIHRFNILDLFHYVSRYASM